MIALLCLVGTKIFASDSTAAKISLGYSFPDDLDSAKVDSFYNRLNIDIHQAYNIDLYCEIFRWYKTCYRWGGNSNKGIDCSHFVNMLCEKIYNRPVGPDAGSIFTKCKVVKKGLDKAEEGDLLFFKIKKGQISHVGIYLQNGRFAHASTHSGVIVSSMEEPYYKKHFFKVGRIE